MSFDSLSIGLPLPVTEPNLTTCWKVLQFGNVCSEFGVSYPKTWGKMPIFAWFYDDIAT